MTTDLDRIAQRILHADSAAEREAVYNHVIDNLSLVEISELSNALVSSVSEEVNALNTLIRVSESADTSTKPAPLKLDTRQTSSGVCPDVVSRESHRYKTDTLEDLPTTGSDHGELERKLDNLLQIEAEHVKSTDATKPLTKQSQDIVHPKIDLRAKKAEKKSKKGAGIKDWVYRTVIAVLLVTMVGLVLL